MDYFNNLESAPCIMLSIRGLKFLQRGLDGTYQLDTIWMVVLGASF